MRLSHDPMTQWNGTHRFHGPWSPEERVLTHANLRVPKHAFLRVVASTDAESNFKRMILLPKTAVKMVRGQEAHIGVQRSEEDDGFFIDDRWLRDWVRRDITAPGNEKKKKKNAEVSVNP